MAQAEITKVKGTITESLPNAQFRVDTEDGRQVLAHLSGKMRLYKIRVMPGDKVVVEMNSYDDKRGRITYREK